MGRLEHRGGLVQARCYDWSPCVHGAEQNVFRSVAFFARSVWREENDINLVVHNIEGGEKERDANGAIEWWFLRGAA